MEKLDQLMEEKGFEKQDEPINLLIENVNYFPNAESDNTDSTPWNTGTEMNVTADNTQIDGTHYGSDNTNNSTYTKNEEQELDIRKNSHDDL